MDIENEWENFLVKEDDSIELNNEREETKEKDIDIPKCTPIYISTKTNIA